MDLVKLLGKNTNKLLKNDTTKIVLTLVLALYSALAAPALPNKVVTFFDSMLGKLLLLFLIGYMASKDIQVALMIAVAFVVTLHVANKRVTENYINNVLENYESYEKKKEEEEEKCPKILGDAVINTCKGQAVDLPKDSIVCKFVQDNAEKCGACDKPEEEPEDKTEDGEEEVVEGFEVNPSNVNSFNYSPISF